MSDKELLTYLQRIQQILNSVATGGDRIQDVEANYIEVYFKLAEELENRDCDNPNPHSSLWDYYSFWGANLPTYQSRRDYVRTLYNDIDDGLRRSIARAERGRSSVRASATNKQVTISFDDLHEDIVIKCKDHFINDKYDEAILNAYKLVELKVRERSGLEASDVGAPLMQKAFEPTQTRFIISDDHGEVSGWMKLYAGSMSAFKNPSSHRFNEISMQEAFHIIAFASFLLGSVENLQIREVVVSADEIDLSEIPF